jgi:hypothetical protein
MATGAQACPVTRHDGPTSLRRTSRFSMRLTTLTSASSALTSRAPRREGSRVDDQLGQLRERFATARTAEDFQAIGLLCRDLLISLSDATFDEDGHVAEGGDTPGQRTKGRAPE